MDWWVCERCTRQPLIITYKCGCVFGLTKHRFCCVVLFFIIFFFLLFVVAVSGWYVCSTTSVSNIPHGIWLVALHAHIRTLRIMRPLRITDTEWMNARTIWIERKLNTTNQLSKEPPPRGFSGCRRQHKYYNIYTDASVYRQPLAAAAQALTAMQTITYIR